MIVTKPATVWIGSPNFRPQPGNAPAFYVVHWAVAANIGQIDDTFKSAYTDVATQYAIDEGTVHQYVLDGDYAYATGSTYGNAKGMSVEHVGGLLLPNGARTRVTEKSLQTSARLLAWASQTYGWGKLEVGKNVFPHHYFTATMCPGDTDLYHLVDMANTLIEEPEPQEEEEEMLYYKDAANDIIYGWDTSIVAPEPALKIIGKPALESGGTVSFAARAITAKIANLTSAQMQKMVDWFGVQPVSKAFYEQLKNNTTIKGLKPVS